MNPTTTYFSKQIYFISFRVIREGLPINPIIKGFPFFIPFWYQNVGGSQQLEKTQKVKVDVRNFWQCLSTICEIRFYGAHLFHLQSFYLERNNRLFYNSSLHGGLWYRLIYRLGSSINSMASKGLSLNDFTLELSVKLGLWFLTFWVRHKRDWAAYKRCLF